MYILNTQSGVKEKAIVMRLELGDLKSIGKNNAFVFDWVMESQKDIYKLQLSETQEIIGLIALEDIPGEIRINIDLLEASKRNVGKYKLYDGVGRILIAFACRLAFTKGYGGFVSLLPKTLLKAHYMQLYGFEEMGTKLFTDDTNSEVLIRKYLDE